MKAYEYFLQGLLLTVTEVRNKRLTKRKNMLITSEQ